jgi:hypothetical protein
MSQSICILQLQLLKRNCTDAKINQEEVLNMWDPVEEEIECRQCKIIDKSNITPMKIKPDDEVNVIVENCDGRILINKKFTVGEYMNIDTTVVFSPEGLFGLQKGIGVVVGQNE